MRLSRDCFSLFRVPFGLRPQEVSILIKVERQTLDQMQILTEVEHDYLIVLHRHYGNKTQQVSSSLYLTVLSCVYVCWSVVTIATYHQGGFHP